MAKIIHEIQIEDDELALAETLKHHFDKTSYPDVRQFRCDIEAIIQNHGLIERFEIGGGGSHVWIKRTQEMNRWERWALITEY